MKKRKKLIEVFNLYGIFEAINDILEEEQIDPLWTIPEDELDLEYLYNHSGEKYITPLVKKLSDENEDGKLTTAQVKFLAHYIIGKYWENWKYLFKAFYAEYNPIENYDRNETHTGTDKTTQTPNDWKQTSESLASDNETVEATEVYAFNGTEPSDSDRTTTTNKSKVETSQEGTYESETEYNSGIRIHGNIGVTTSQQMIESEIKLREYNLFNIVMKNIDNILCLDIY